MTKPTVGPHRCDRCGGPARRTRFQEKAKSHDDRCEACIIDTCEHTGGTRTAPQSGIEVCAKCGVAVA